MNEPGEQYDAASSSAMRNRSMALSPAATRAIQGSVKALSRMKKARKPPSIGERVCCLMRVLVAVPLCHVRVHVVVVQVVPHVEAWPFVAALEGSCSSLANVFLRCCWVPGWLGLACNEDDLGGVLMFCDLVAVKFP